MYCSNTDCDPEQHIHLHGKRNTLHEVCKAHLPCFGVRSHCFSGVLQGLCTQAIGACAPHVVCGTFYSVLESYLHLFTYIISCFRLGCFQSFTKNEVETLMKLLDAFSVQHLCTLTP